MLVCLIQFPMLIDSTYVHLVSMDHWISYGSHDLPRRLDILTHRHDMLAYGWNNEQLELKERSNVL